MVVDDGSSDGSAQALQLVAAQDDRISFVRQSENSGVARARRRGVETAKGEWVWFVDSDDEWPDDAVGNLLAAAGVTPGRDDDTVDMVVADAELVPMTGGVRRISSPRSGRVTGSAAVEMLLTGDITGHLWNKLFRRRLLLQVEFPPAHVQSDLALVAGALSEARVVVPTSAVVYRYLKRAGSVITSSSRRAESLAVVERSVLGAARRAGVAEDNPALAYFCLRYIALSGVKDALGGAYDEATSRSLLRSLRRRIGVRGVVTLARRRDKRVALAVLAHAPRPVQVRLLNPSSRLLA